MPWWPRWTPAPSATPIRSAVRRAAQFHKLITARDDGTLDKISDLFRQLQSAQSFQTLSATVSGLSRTLQGAVGSRCTTWGWITRAPRGRRSPWCKSGANDLASAGRQVADGVQILVDQVKRMGVGLGRASDFLIGMGQDASQPSMAGFNIPAGVLGTEDFKKLAQSFISPDGHSVRYFVQTDLDPFSTNAMNQVNTILDTAKGAQPNTTLSDASMSISGYPVTLSDTRDYYDRDIELIVIVTIVVVLLILVGCCARWWRRCTWSAR